MVAREHLCGPTTELRVWNATWTQPMESSCSWPPAHSCTLRSHELKTTQPQTEGDPTLSHRREATGGLSDHSGCGVNPNTCFCASEQMRVPVE